VLPQRCIVGIDVGPSCSKGLIVSSEGETYSRVAVCHNRKIKGGPGARELAPYAAQ
jgi:hypothetical protein